MPILYLCCVKLSTSVADNLVQLVTLKLRTVLEGMLGLLKLCKQKFPRYTRSKNSVSKVAQSNSDLLLQSTSLEVVNDINLFSPQFEVFLSPLSLRLCRD